MSGDDCDASLSPDNWQNFPDAPDFGDEGFPFSGNVLEGFEEIMDMTPNVAPVESFAAHGFGQSTSPSAPTPLPAAAEERSRPRRAVAEAPSRKLTGTADRRQLRNRMSQRRFRERQKARSQTLESELEEASAQLEQLQRTQTALKTKIQLLEKLVQLNKQADIRATTESPTSSATVLDLYKQRGFKTVTEPILAVRQTEPAIRLTLSASGEQLIPVEQIGKMSIQEFSKLYAAYVHQMAACLAQLSDDKLADESTAPAECRLRELLSELSSMIMIIVISNPTGFKDIQNCDFEEGVVRHDAQPPSFYSNIMAHMQFTDAQMQDALYLRHLFYGKLGQLQRERRALLQSMTQGQVALDHASDKLSKMTTWSDQLRENGAEEYRCYMQFITAFFRGISTTKQFCTGMVCGFPWLPAITKLVEAEAVQIGEPPMQMFVEDMSVSDLQHAADWADVALYLEGITEQDVHRHVPLMPHVDKQLLHPQ